MMKARLVFTGFLLFLFSLVQGQLIQGTIKPGANPQEIEVWIRPDFNNSTEYLFQIGMPIAFPTSATPAPTDLTVALDPSFVTTFGNNYSVTVNPVATGNGGTESYFNIVLIRGGVGASNPQTWVSGTEYKVLTATFVPSGSPNTQVKLADYQDGGSDGQGNFYTVSGNGNYYVTTNSIGNFYASAGNSSVGGSASAGYAQTIETVPPGACAPPGLVVGSITTTSAAVSWTAVGGAAGYAYAVTTSPTPPGSGTPTTSTSLDLADLTASTTYYVHVLTDCGGGNLSSWSSISFTTSSPPPTCTAPGVPVVSSVTETTAIINWTAVSGVVSYEYVVSTSAVPPGEGVSGTTIFTTSLIATGLTPLTTYYFHLRSKCDEGFFSEWVSSASFTTGGCAVPVVTVDVNGTSAAIEWRDISNTATYEYALTTNMTAPTGGVSTGDTVKSFSGLKAGTTYYFHVRTHCSGGGLSGWRTEVLHTEGIEVYPNPVRSTLTINLYGVDDEDVMLGLYDATGKLVMRIQVVDGNRTVDVRALAAGVYTLRYMEGGKKHWVRVIKR